MTPQRQSDCCYSHPQASKCAECTRERHTHALTHHIHPSARHVHLQQPALHEIACPHTPEHTTADNLSGRSVPCRARSWRQCQCDDGCVSRQKNCAGLVQHPAPAPAAGRKHPPLQVDSYISSPTPTTHTHTTKATLVNSTSKTNHHHCPVITIISHRITLHSTSVSQQQQEEGAGRSGWTSLLLCAGALLSSHCHCRRRCCC